MKIAIIYYSKTGKTRKIVEKILEELSKYNINVKCFELKNIKEYSNILLHLNLKLMYETLSDKVVEINGDQEFNPNNYQLIIIGSPIWYGREVPAIRTFIKKHSGKVKTQIICFTTSTLDVDYSRKFKDKLEALGYKVVFSKTISTKNWEIKVNELIENIKNVLKCN